MGETPQHLKTLEEIERECLPGLVQVLREGGLEAVRYFLWDRTGWHHDHDPVLRRHRATEGHKRVGWEMWVRMDKIMCTVLREAHERQIEETMVALEDGPERFYKSYLEERRGRGPSTPGSRSCLHETLPPAVRNAPCAS